MSSRNIILIVAILRASILWAIEPIPPVTTSLMGMPSIARPDLITLGSSFDLDRPASHIYAEWSNSYVHQYGDVDFPDSILISMVGYHMPTDSTRITDTFGYRPRRRTMHYGLDIKVLVGDTIRAAFDGKVRVSRYERRGYGYYLVLRHPNGLETVYAHLSKKLVVENQIVKAGEPIALGGNTGRSTGSHLHFETRILGKPINPAILFDFPNQKAKVVSYLYNSKESERYYKVRSGDTLTRIAIRNETTIANICKLNGISRNSTLRVGQVLRVN